MQHGAEPAWNSRSRSSPQDSYLRECSELVNKQAIAKTRQSRLFRLSDGFGMESPDLVRFLFSFQRKQESHESVRLEICVVV